MSTIPVPDQSKLYSVHYDRYRSHQTGQRFPWFLDRFMRLWRYLRAYRIARLARGGRVLDIGCGQAVELQILKSLGLEVVGLEYSQDYASGVSKQTGIQVYAGHLADIPLSSGTFRVITFLHSLEHIPQTKETLIACYRLLEKDGYVIISVPNSASFEARLFGAGWFHLDIPRHLYHFSEEYVKKYVQACGLTYVATKRIAPEYDFFSFLQSSLNVCYPRNTNLLYRMLLREERKTVRDYVNLIWQSPVIMFFIVISIPATLILWTIKGSGTVELTFRKDGKK